MIEINSFGVLGGDQRQASMAESMAADGYPVLCAGFGACQKGKNLKKGRMAGGAESGLYYPASSGNKGRRDPERSLCGNGAFAGSGIL